MRRAHGRFNVYVAQPEVKPGCVFRRSNISLLEKKKLVTDKEVCALACLTPAVSGVITGDVDEQMSSRQQVTPQSPVLTASVIH